MRNALPLADPETGMITVPGGTIVMRDEGTGRTWTERVAPFRLARFPVTRAQYAALVDGFGAGDHGLRPVTDVSWNDAVAFCNVASVNAGFSAAYAALADGGEELSCDFAATGFRLPTEAEWELACRAGSNEPRYGELDAIAWYRENSGDRLHDVGSKEPNAWGLHDMLGNAWEWCWDLYDPAVYGSYRVFRGGGFSDLPRGCRASCRRKSHPTFAIDDIGFRLACSLPTDAS